MDYTEALLLVFLDLFQLQVSTSVATSFLKRILFSLSIYNNIHLYPTWLVEFSLNRLPVQYLSQLTLSRKEDKSKIYLKAITTPMTLMR